MQSLQVSDRRRSGIRKDPVGARERVREQQLTEWTRCKGNKTLESMQPCQPNACCKKQSTKFTSPTISDKGATWLPLGSAHRQCSPRGLFVHKKCGKPVLDQEKKASET